MKLHQLDRDIALENYIYRWQREVGIPLMEWQRTLNEATLTADQINSLFVDVEKNMASSKTVIGKGAAVAGKTAKVAAKFLPNNVMNKVHELIKDTKPVKNFEQRFAEVKSMLRDAMGGDDSKVLAVVDGYAKFAKKHPALGGAIIAVISIATGIVSGPAGGALVGAFLRSVNELLKGETFTGSMLKGAGTGLVAMIASMGVKELAHLIGDPLIQQIYDAQLAKDPGTSISTASSMVNISQDLADGTTETKHLMLTVVGTPQEIDRFNNIIEQVQAALEDGDTEMASKLMTHLSNDTINPDDLVDAVERMSPDGKRKVVHWFGNFMGKQLADQSDISDAIMQVATDFENKVELIQQGLENATPGVVAGVMGSERSKTKTAESRQLNEADVKGIANSIVKWAAKQGSNITKKFTADKLTKLWKESGSTTDSDEIHVLLVNAGIPMPVVDAAFKTAGIRLPVKDKSKPGTITIKTGDKEFDARINEIIAKHGKEEAVKHLKNLKKRLAKKPARAA